MGNDTKIIEDKIQQVTSQWNLYLSTASTLPSMFSCLLIGTLSEQYGRRLAILLPAVGFLGQCSVDILVMYLTLPLGYLLIGSLFSGCCGNLALFMAGCFSYVTDITNEKQRMMRIVWIEILMFIGISVMQVGLGYLIVLIGYAMSLWIPFAALLIGVINAGVPLLLIETVNVSQKTKGALTKALKDIVILYRVKTDNRHILLMAMVVLIILVGISTQGSIAITALYGQGQPFCWDSVTIGYFVTVSLAVPGVGTVIGASIFKRLKLSAMWIIQIALISATTNMLVLGCTSFIPSTGLIFGSTVFGAFRLLGVPVVRAFLSTRVQEHEYGALFSSVGVQDSVAQFLATPVVNGIYYATVDVLSTIVFFFMAGLLMIPIFILGILQYNGIGKKRPEKRPLTINSNDVDEIGGNDETRPLIVNE